MNVLIWPGLAVIVTVAMMAFERRSNPREDPSTTSTPVHYGHSDVADHEYEDLPRGSSGALQSLKRRVNRCRSSPAESIPSEVAPRARRRPSAEALTPGE